MQSGILILMPRVSPHTSRQVKKAELFAEKAHAGQFRTSGEPFVNHVKAVANLLKEIYADDQTVIAALLHDTVEDTNVTYKDIEREFGKEVVLLVDGVTKVEIVGMQTDKKERNLQFLRKMFRAMGKDIRVIFIKIADRMHNMQTLDAVPAEKQMRIARETQDIYCPLADLLGMRNWYQELSDRCFRVLHAPEYDLITRKAQETWKKQGTDLEHWTNKLQKQLLTDGWKGAKVSLVERHFHSIYKEHMLSDSQLQHVETFHRVLVCVPDGSDCYSCLGDVHRFSPPLPQQMDDYIAAPKMNGYQALHTTVFTTSGHPVDIVIQTTSMVKQAQFGMAMLYQEKNKLKKSTEMPEWIETLVSLERDEQDLYAFFSTIQNEIFGEQNRISVVLNDKKKTVDVPLDATVLDLAYYASESTGKHAASASVNGIPVPLTKEVNAGDIVKFQMAKDFMRSAKDIRFLRTSFAENLLLSNLASLPKQEQTRRGQEILNRTVDIAMDPFFSITWQKSVREKMGGTPNVLANIGNGIVNPFQHMEEHSAPEDFLLLDPSVFHDVSGLMRASSMRFVLRTEMGELQAGNIIGLQAGPDIMEVISADAPANEKRFSKEFVPLLVRKELLRYPMHFAFRFSYTKDANPLEAISELQGLLTTPVKLLKFEPSSITLGFNTDRLRPLQIAYEYLFGLPYVSHIFRITP